MRIRVENLSRTFFRQGKETNFFYAIKDVNLELPSGSITEIVGKSGSGKSTLLNVIAGILTPTGGKVFFDDVDIYSLGDKERSKLRNEKVGVIPQGQTGLQSLTVLENVLVPCMLRGDFNGENKALELLKQVGILELVSAYPNELSGGELRRMAIARALINNPDIILADEPTGDLDDENTEIVLNLFKTLANDGKTILLVTHDRDADKFADNVFKMDKGNLSQETNN
ncbi:MAG: ABC transporter ATP-binding protein [Clostridia bacterium]|nr:ABC transporter ATP-binding protein [Clostridia bacterium]